MEDSNVALAIQNAKEKVVNRFGGSSNTLELQNSVLELFNNQKSLILINNIRGKCTAFEAGLTAKISSPEKGFFLLLFLFFIYGFFFLKKQRCHGLAEKFSQIHGNPRKLQHKTQ